MCSTVRAGPHRGELDRERQAVEATAELDDRCLVAGGQLECARAAAARSANSMTASFSRS